MCGSRKKFIRGGGGGVLTAKFLEEMYENKLEFPGGRVDANQKNLPWGDCGYQGGLAAAFDLAASEGYMIARVKKSVNHSGIIQSMR